MVALVTKANQGDQPSISKMKSLSTAAKGGSTAALTTMQLAAAVNAKQKGTTAPELEEVEE